MARIIIGLVLLAHGIGHSMGLLGLFKVATVNPAMERRLVAAAGVGRPDAAPGRRRGPLDVSMVGFVALAGVAFGWLPEDLVGAPWRSSRRSASLAGVLFFPVAFPTFSTIGAVAVDVAVLVATLWFHWTPADLSA